MVQKLDIGGEELDSRARDVLREIILQHVATGEPISSRSLSKGGHFQLSPASLRNVMADLEDLGYLAQPHTSAGRVPTDRGYRFFIDHLMKSHVLSQRERQTIDGEVANAGETGDSKSLTAPRRSHHLRKTRTARRFSTTYCGERFGVLTIGFPITGFPFTPI